MIYADREDTILTVITFPEAATKQPLPAKWRVRADTLSFANFTDEASGRRRRA